MLFTGAIKKFEAHQEAAGLADTTLRGYRSQLADFGRWVQKRYNGPVYVDEVDQEDLDSYMLLQKDKGNATTSRRRAVYILRAFFGYAKKQGLSDNPAEDLQPPKARKKERTYLTESEMDRVISCIDHPLVRAVAVFLYYTGCRIGECLELETGDVDLANGIIHVKKAKGNKDRDIAISSALRAELEGYLEDVRPDVGTRRLFATKRSGKLTAVYFNRVLKVAVEKAGIGKDISAHSIRHSSAVALVNRGVDLPTVQRILGHDNLSTTSVYLHSDMSKMREALETMHSG